MSENSTRPKKPARSKRAQKRNHIGRRKNISQLVSPLPKSVGGPLPFPTKKSNLQYAENLLAAAMEFYPEQTKLLKFNPDFDTLNNLVSSLIEILTEENNPNFIDDFRWKIIIGDDREINGHEMILATPIDFDWMFYNVDFTDIYKIKNQALRVGFAHLLKNIGGGSMYNVLEYQYEKAEDNLYQCVFEYYESAEFEEYMMDEDADPEEFDNEPAHEKAWQHCEQRLIEFRKHKEVYKKYVSQDVEKFFKCRPRDQKEKELKEFIIEGLQIDFTVIRKFIDSTDGSNGDVSFSDAFIIMFDSADGFEEEWFRGIEDQANQVGVTYPCAYYGVNNGVVTLEITNEHVQEFYKITNYIPRIYEKHFKNL